MNDLLWWKNPKCPPPPPVPCFVEGSLVYTSKGKIPVQDVKEDTLVLTRDNGYLPVVWSGSSIGLQTVQFESTATSPNHRMVVRANNEEILVAAKKLTVVTKHAKPVTKTVKFIHFLLEQHQLVNVDGVWSESFFPGPWILDNLGSADRGQIIRSVDVSNYTKVRNEVVKIGDLKQLSILMMVA